MTLNITPNFAIKATSFNKITLVLYKHFLIKYFLKLNLQTSVIFLPKKKKKITLLSSPHVFKKAREQFEIITYSFSVYIFNTNLPNFQIFSPKTVKTVFYHKNINYDQKI